jgi:hypothetical protein
MKKILPILAFVVLTLSAKAENLWKEQSSTLSTFGEKKIIPNEFKVFSLNKNMFTEIQSKTPELSSNQKSTILLPNPNGEMIEFLIAEAPIMESGLAAKYAGIKTYTIIQANDRSIIGKLDYTLFGLHAMIQQGEDSWFIDPYTNVNTDNYVVYYKKNYSKPLNERMICEVDEHLTEPIDGAGAKTHGTETRTYRLAVACTGEYAYAVAGPIPTKATVLSAIVTSVNRVSGVYEKELGIKFILISNNDQIIFLDSIADGFTNFTASALIGQSQSKITATIGAANFDIGHTFSTGGGGLASAGVCQSNKASGITGSSIPKGDPYDIDYVAHEIGHQFSASHTFEAATGNCSGNRVNSSAYEQGSGTTIMAYAGICDANDVQNNSDAYFCIRSLDQITTYIASANHTCPVKAATGNNPPTFEAILKTHYVPHLTYLELNKTASDINGHAIAYCWEEFDRTGSNNGTNWNAKTTKAPLFRSIFYKADSNRLFPKPSLINGNVYSSIGERAPDTNRSLSFKLVVRDVNANGFGSYKISDDSIKVISKMLPSLFRVTSQATGVTYNGNQSISLTWDVAGTNTDAQINATNVDISYSVDGCVSFPYILAKNIPNNGSTNITIPNIATVKGRIRVKASNNIFFDVNNGLIKVNPITYPASISDNMLSNVNIFPNPAQDLLAIDGIIGNYDISITNAIGKEVLNVKGSAQTKLDIKNLANGIYFVKINAGKQHTTQKILVQK